MRTDSLSPIHRCPSEGYSNTVTWLCGLMQVDRQTATHLLWDKCFTIGTDRHYYIDVQHAQRYLDTK